MIRVIGEKLKQYEKERSVEIAPRKGFNLRRVCFAKNGIWYAASVEEDGELYTAMIPDALLMATGTLTVRCDGINDEGIKASEKANFVIHRAKKPEGYVEPEIDMSSGGSGGVSSWNDLTDKPFYKEEGVVEILPETEFEFIQENTLYVCQTTLEQNLFELGKTYKVLWDGKEYNCLSYEFSAAGMSNITLGNMTISDNTGMYEDTGETFNMAFVTMDGMHIMVVQTTEQASKHTISITCNDTVIKTLDKEYLPSVAEQLSEVSEVVILPETTLEFAMDGDINSSYIESAPSLEVGETYIVKWENVEYECTAFEDGAVMLIQFDENFNQISPFSVIDVNAIDDVPHSYIIETDGTETTYTVGIYQKSTTYTKLPEEVLPDLSDNYDLVIEFNVHPYDAISNSSFKITRGSISDIFPVVRAGGYPKVKIRYRYGEDNSFTPSRYETDANIELYDENVWISWILYSSAGLCAYKALFLADGTISTSSIYTHSATLKP